MNIRKSIGATLLGALLLSGCGGGALNTNSSSSPSAPVTSDLARSSENPAPEILARGLLPGADLSRDAHSGNGNFITFCSSDATLVDGDNNGHSDVYRYNRAGNSFVRVSLSASGAQPNGPCWRASSSADGRYVVFDSTATNLVPGDTNARGDVFRKDTETGTVVVVSSPSSGVSNGVSDQPVISDDGRYVAFRSSATNLVTGDTNRVSDIFVRDMQTGIISVISVGANRASANPSISGDGRYISFDTASTTLADSGGGQPTSGRSHVFVRDTQNNLFIWCSRREDGNEGAGQSSSGHLARNGTGIAFVSTSSDLSAIAASGEQIYNRALSSGPCTLVSKTGSTPANGSCRLPAMSGTGQRVAYLSQATNLVSGKTDNNFDVFRTDQSTGSTQRRSNPNGANDASCEQVAISRDGFETNFRTLSSTVVAGDIDGDDDLFNSFGAALPPQLTKLLDMVRVSVGGSTAGDNDSIEAELSGDAQYTVFSSSAANLVPGDTNGLYDVFVQNRKTGVTQRVSIGSSGQGNNHSSQPSVSADGRYIAFASRSSNFVAGDSNGAVDVFVYDRETNSTQRVSIGSGGQGNADSSEPHISANGRYVTFQSSASNLVAGDSNGTSDIFVYDQTTGITELVSVGASGQSNFPSFQPCISSDGRLIAFSSLASNLVTGDTNNTSDIFVRDRTTGTTERVSIGLAGQSDGSSFNACISVDGRHVGFSSIATNLVASDTNQYLDVFVRDRTNGITQRVSMGTNGEGNHNSDYPKISADGRYVCFSSMASNLTSGDSNGQVSDVFIHDRTSGITKLVSVGPNGQGNSERPSISADGLYVAFQSSASINLIYANPDFRSQIFLKKLLP